MTDLNLFSDPTPTASAVDARATAGNAVTADPVTGTAVTGNGAAGDLTAVLTLGDHTTATRPPPGEPAVPEEIEFGVAGVARGNRLRALRSPASWAPVRRFRASRWVCLPHPSHGQPRPPARRPPASRLRGTFWGCLMCWWWGCGPSAVSALRSACVWWGAVRRVWRR